MDLSPIIHACVRGVFCSCSSLLLRKVFTAFTQQACVITSSCPIFRSNLINAAAVRKECRVSKGGYQEDWPGFAIFIP